MWMGGKASPGLCPIRSQHPGFSPRDDTLSKKKCFSSFASNHVSAELGRCSESLAVRKEWWLNLQSFLNIVNPEFCFCRPPWTQDTGYLGAGGADTSPKIDTRLGSLPCPHAWLWCSHFYMPCYTHHFWTSQKPMHFWALAIKHTVLGQAVKSLKWKSIPSPFHGD